MPSFSQFRRLTVAEQAAAVIRDDIRRGVWAGTLPSENELAVHLSISRPSVHAALVALMSEGLVEVSHGRPARIVAERPAGNAPSMVCFLQPYPRTIARVVHDTLILKLRADLMKQGIGWEDIFDARLARRDCGDHLRRLAGTRGHACWVMDAAPALQRWFHNAGLPALVTGSCHPGVKLPSVDVDYHAAGWHAAGCIARLGHRSILLILPHGFGPGDLATRDGVADYIAKTGADISLVEIETGISHESFKSRFSRALARKRRPTVVFTMRPEGSLSAIYHLQGAGLRVPQDISLVSRDTNDVHRLGWPELTSYHASLDRMATVCVRLIQSLLAGRPVPPTPHLITPTYIPGETLARPPAAASANAAPVDPA